jgi:signal transduction histidine kinase
MARFCLLALSFLLSFALHAQSNLDSLQQALNTVSNDSLRVQLLLRLSSALQFEEIDRSKALLDEATQLAETKQWNWARLQVYRAQSYSALLRGDYSTCLRFDNQRLSLAVSLKDSTQTIDALNYIGDTYQALGEYDEAYFYFTKSYKMAQAKNDTLMMAVTMHNVGRVFKELGQYEIALQHFNFSQRLSDLFEDFDGQAYNLDELGDLYMRQQNFEKSEQALQQSLRVTRERKIQILEPQTLSKLARLYLRKNDLLKSNAYWDSTLWLHQKTKNVFGIALAELGRGQLQIRQGNYASATELISASLAMAKQLNARILEIECLKELSNLNEQRGDIKAAFDYFKNYKSLQDSLFSEEMLEKLFQDQVRFETEVKDTEIAALSRAQQVQRDALKREELFRNILVVVAALSALLLFAVYRSGQRKIKMNKILMEHQAEIEARSKELEELNKVKDKFFSIISHDLRSPMNALAGILELSEKGAIAPEEFPKITKELRTQFNHTRTLINNLLDWALLQMDKLKIVEERIDLHQMAEENFRLLSSMHLKKMNLVNAIPEGQLALADKNMANLIFRNLILNAIKFTEEGGNISIRSSAQGALLRISVEDNGVGIRPEVQKIIFEKTSGYSTRGTANEKGTGLGLILCKEFVERNGGSIWVESEVGKGTTFHFTLKKA